MSILITRIVIIVILQIFAVKIIKLFTFMQFRSHSIYLNFGKWECFNGELLAIETLFVFDKMLVFNFITQAFDFASIIVVVLIKRSPWELCLKFIELFGLILLFPIHLEIARIQSRNKSNINFLARENFFDHSNIILVHSHGDFDPLWRSRKLNVVFLFMVIQFDHVILR